MTAAPHDPEDANDTLQAPSKSARKRAAHDAQHLGEALVRLRDAELDALQLPEALSEAIRAARNITSRAAAARQRQYIGKLMRAVDVEPIRAALAAHGERAARESERFNWQRRQKLFRLIDLQHWSRQMRSQKTCVGQ